jgi:TRAP-type C4-dicarboxylate transport system permease small subunit
MPDSWRDKADRGIAALIAAGGWLVLPVSVLLFLQWPLRDLVHAHSSEANDLAQWLFALYVSLAVTYATRERSHLAVDTLAQGYAAATRARLARAAAAICIAPWAAFVLIAGAPTIWQSVRQLEAFSETSNPGYFIVKASAWLLALLALAQALLDASRPAKAP